MKPCYLLLPALSSGCIAAEIVRGSPLFQGNNNLEQISVIASCFGSLPQRFQSSFYEMMEETVRFSSKPSLAEM